MRRPLALITPLLAAVGLAAAARTAAAQAPCGDPLLPACQPPVEQPAPALEGALSAETYQRLDAFFGSRSPKEFKRTCTKLPLTDTPGPERGHRGICRRDIRTGRAFNRFNRCKSARICGRNADVLYRALRAERRSMQLANADIRAGVLAGACREGLSVPKRDIESYGKLVSAYRLVARAYAEGSVPLYKQGLRRARALDFSKRRSLADYQRLLRAACGPA